MISPQRAFGPRPSAPRTVCLGLVRLAALLMGISPLAAQVGHDPAHSPYRDLKYTQFITATVGYMGGTGGVLGIGPHSGRVITLRHDFLANHPLNIALGAGFAQLERRYMDTALATYGVKGPVEHDVWFGEGTVQFNVAGGKTWHNLAPYASMTLGMAFAKKLPQDTSGYKFSTKFYVAPAGGARVFLSRRLYLRLEARVMFWSLSYPNAFRVNDPDGFGPMQPILAGQAIKEWSPVPMLHAGLGYSFRRPFF